MSAEFSRILAQLLDRKASEGGEPLGSEDVRSAFRSILAGAWSPAQVAAFAVALRMVGEGANTIAAAAEAVRDAMTPVEHDWPLVVDTCGTGGDGAHTLNLSSAAALVVAACDFRVAKHGNRSASSRCGSADVLEAMGIPIDLPPKVQSHVLREAGIAFLFATAHHPALRHAAQARRELGTRTIFNALGPLVNPARATHQLVGVYEDRLRAVLAGALGRLGLTRAWVVHGEDGLDEVSPCARTRVSELTPEGEVREFVIAPEDFGIERLRPSALTGGDATQNASAIESILDGHAHPAKDAVILNAAAAITVAGGGPPRLAADRARAAIDRGDARATFDRWKRIAVQARDSAKES